MNIDRKIKIKYGTTAGLAKYAKPARLHNDYRIQMNQV